MQDTMPSALKRIRAFFEPRSVALIGATDVPNQLGRLFAIRMLAYGAQSGAKIHLINAKRRPLELYEDAEPVSTYGSLTEIGATSIDLAIIVTKAPTVPAIIRDCVAANITSAIVISAGFGESGSAGAHLEKELLEAAGDKLALFGPNCFGAMNPHSGFNATFCYVMPKPGGVCLIAQSGGVAADIADRCLARGIGMSHITSFGSMRGVDFADMITYEGMNPHTKVIALYVESVGKSARKFCAAIRASKKPVIVLKPGRTHSGQKAAASHTGAMVGGDRAFDAALMRAGALRVFDQDAFLNVLTILERYPNISGANPVVVTNGGGYVTNATDTLEEGGVSLAKLKPETIERLSAVLPPMWSHGNPVDIIGDGGRERYFAALDTVMSDRGVSLVLAAFVPLALDTKQVEEPEQAIANEIARAIVDANKKYPGVPLIAIPGGQASIGRAIEIFHEAKVPVIKSPDAAAVALGYIKRWRTIQQALYDTPHDSGTYFEELRIAFLKEELRKVREGGATQLPEMSSKWLMSQFNISVNPTQLVHSASEAVLQAKLMGYPVVLKINSAEHKSDRGGVMLNLGSETEVRLAYEAIEKNWKGPGQEFLGITVQPMISPPKEGVIRLIAGVKSDKVFGPVISVGEGDVDAEIRNDIAVDVVPLNTALAHALVKRTRIGKLLGRYRGKFTDEKAIAELLTQLATMAHHLWEHVKEVDINPIIVPRDGGPVIAVDARIILWGKDEKPVTPAIRHYPYWMTSEHRMRGVGRHDAKEYVVRAVRPEDERAYTEFQRHLSSEAISNRFMAWVPLEKRESHLYTSMRCNIDYENEMAFVAELKTTRAIIGIGRLMKLCGGEEAEVAFIVEDDSVSDKNFQGLGIGRTLLRKLIEFAQGEPDLKRVVAVTLARNTPMVELFKQEGFALQKEEGEVYATLELV